MTILLLFLPFMFSFAATICPNGAMMTVNGNSGAEDRCEFYLDIERVGNMTSKECHTILIPPTKPQNTRDCTRLVDQYFKSGVKASSRNFENSLEKTLKLGGDKTVVTITDHGNKVPSDTTKMQSSFSIGEGSINENELRQMLLKAREDQKKSVCQGKLDCPLPPLVMNFDHCYSGGMQNAFFNQEGNPIENVCGISSSSPNEVSYSGENLSRAIDELRTRVKDPDEDIRNLFLSFDQNQDGKFSVSEVQNYLNERTRKSVPIKTSDKFLLDHFEKSQLSVPEDICVVQSQVKPMSGLGYVGYHIDFNHFHQTAAKILDKEGVIQEDQIQRLIQEEKEAKLAMMSEEERSESLQKINEKFLESLQNHAYSELTRLESQLMRLSEEREKKLVQHCEEDSNCKKMSEKIQRLNEDLFQATESGDDKKFEEINDEFIQLKKKMKRYQDELVEKACSGVCSDLKKTDLELKKIEQLYLGEKQNFFKDPQKKKQVIEKNKVDMTKYFDEIESFIKPFKNPELNSLLNKEKKKMMSDSFLTKVETSEFYSELLNFTDKLRPILANNQEDAHLKYIKSRKALNQLKMSTGLKKLIETGDHEKLKQYDMLKKCEETTLIQYKRIAK